MNTNNKKKITEDLKQTEEIIKANNMINEEDSSLNLNLNSINFEMENISNLTFGKDEKENKNNSKNDLCIKEGENLNTKKDKDKVFF